MVISIARQVGIAPSNTLVQLERAIFSSGTSFNVAAFVTVWSALTAGRDIFSLFAGMGMALISFPRSSDRSKNIRFTVRVPVLASFAGSREKRRRTRFQSWPTIAATEVLTKSSRCMVTKTISGRSLSAATWAGVRWDDADSRSRDRATG